MIEKLPEKWCILVDELNQDILSDYYRENIEKYIGCSSLWSPGLGGYFHYPQIVSGCHTCMINTIKANKYKEITINEFQKFVLKSNIKTEFLIFN